MDNGRTTTRRAMDAIYSAAEQHQPTYCYYYYYYHYYYYYYYYYQFLRVSRTK